MELKTAWHPVGQLKGPGPFREGLAAIRRELDLPGAFSAEALAEAERLPDVRRASGSSSSSSRSTRRARATSTRRCTSRGASDGFRVSYAIADPGSFITPGGALDREAHARGATLYLPDGEDPAVPAGALGGRGLPAPRRVAPRGAVDDRPRRGRRSGRAWTWRGGWCAASRSTPTTTCPAAVAPLLQEIGELRLAVERARGGVRLPRPEQEVVPQDGGWTLALPRATTSTRSTTRRSRCCAGWPRRRRCWRRTSASCARSRTLRRGAFERLRLDRRTRWAWTWPARRHLPGVRAPARRRRSRRTPRSCTRRRGSAPARATRPSTASCPEVSTHWAVAAPYAHATAPLRRLQDRYVSDCCLGRPDRRGVAGPAGDDGGRFAPRGRRGPRRGRPRRGRDPRRAARARRSTPSSSTTASSSSASPPCARRSRARPRRVARWSCDSSAPTRPPAPCSSRSEMHLGHDDRRARRSSSPRRTSPPTA